jgi:hypothetical protein
MHSLHKLILTVASLVTLVLLAATFLLYSASSSRLIEQATHQQSATIARLTFANMLQLMTLGWNREQVVNFTSKAAQSLTNRPVRIDFYRGKPVEQKFGMVRQQIVDNEIQAALQHGKASESTSERGGRYVYPLVADDRCLGCHENARKGDVLGAISVLTSFDRGLNETRRLMLIILLLIMPLPIVGAALVVWFMNSRFERFYAQLDASLGHAARTGEAIDLSRVKPGFSELGEILDRIHLLLRQR